ncbi:GNAT family N-acetyltransferase [Candidatus Latescibacterota bacterium]
MITIRKYRRGDARSIAALISKTYSRFNRHEGTKQAVREYVESYNPKGKKTEDIHKRFSRTPNCFVAVVGSRVVGMVRGIENRLINLFVDGNYHRQGIATRLVERFEKTCRKAGFKDIVLRGSLYATTFYESMSYKKTTGIRNFQGLKVQPMKKIL